jgi:hypothetical protein
MGVSFVVWLVTQMLESRGLNSTRGICPPEVPAIAEVQEPGLHGALHFVLGEAVWQGTGSSHGAMRPAFEFRVVTVLPIVAVFRGMSMTRSILRSACCADMLLAWAAGCW